MTLKFEQLLHTLDVGSVLQNVIVYTLIFTMFSIVLVQHEIISGRRSKKPKKAKDSL
jgi:hypothetical protein